MYPLPYTYSTLLHLPCPTSTLVISEAIPIVPQAHGLHQSSLCTLLDSISFTVSISHAFWPCANHLKEII